MSRYLLILILLIGCAKPECNSYLTVYNETAEGMAVDVNNVYIGDVGSFCEATFVVGNGKNVVVLSSYKGFVALKKETVYLNCEEYYTKFNY